jgi:hypothetical protein
VNLVNIFRNTVSLALAAALVVPLASSSAAAAAPEILRLRAFAIDLNNRAKTNTIDIVIERWSTDEEVAALKAVLVEKGSDKLLSALQKVKPRCGYARTSTSLGWDINFARVVGVAQRRAVAGLRVLARRDPPSRGGQGPGQGDQGRDGDLQQGKEHPRDRELPARAGSAERDHGADPRRGFATPVDLL